MTIIAVRLGNGSLTTIISKKKILEKIMLDCGALISVALFIVFIFLAIIWNRDNLFWGTGVFIVLSLLFSMRRLKQSSARPRSEDKSRISFQSMAFYTAAENQKAIRNLQNSLLRIVASAFFLVFIPLDLVIQIIYFAVFDTSGNETK